MGIRYEKDTLLNWINEMGKFLRLLVDKWENLSEVPEHPDVASAYKEFFNVNRDFFETIDDRTLENFADQLEPEKIRPLAQMLTYDGLLSHNNFILEKAKFLLDLHMKRSNSFAFEDYGLLSTIEQALKRN